MCKKVCFFTSSLKEMVRAVFEILTSDLISGSPKSTFGFSTFAKTWKYHLSIYVVLVVKFSVSIFISFGDIKHWVFSTQSQIYRHAYICTDQFSKIFFCTVGSCNESKNNLSFTKYFKICLIYSQYLFTVLSFSQMYNQWINFTHFYISYHVVIMLHSIHIWMVESMWMLSSGMLCTSFVISVTKFFCKFRSKWNL